jgi:hypothetical protein
MVGAESKNMRLLAHNDLNERGNGGKGIALQQTAGGQPGSGMGSERPWE